VYSLTQNENLACIKRKRKNGRSKQVNQDKNQNIKREFKTIVTLNRNSRNDDEVPISVCQNGNFIC